MHKTRLENISDAIFAIIMTLMVIDIRPPMIGALVISEFIREIVIYGLSYIMIIILWIHHHYLFSIMKQINNTIIGLNFTLLFFITLIPIPTKILGLYFALKSSHIFYGVIMITNSLTFFLLEWQVKRSLLKGSDIHRSINLKTLLLIGLYVLAMPLSFLNIYASLVVYLVAPLLYTFLTKADRTV